MDEIVKAALKKWPNVPACRGWLALDARGDWYMRDDRVQAAGSFPRVKGSRIQHDKLRDFIERYYAHDDDGAWYFQNGPQRVFVELAATPWIWRVQADFSLRTHTDLATHCTACLMDEHGWLYLESPLGFGLVHTQDVALAAQAVESGLWVVQPVKRSDLSTRYGYTISPAQNHMTLQK